MGNIAHRGFMGHRERAFIGWQFKTTANGAFSFGFNYTGPDAPVVDMGDGFNGVVTGGPAFTVSHTYLSSADKTVSIHVDDPSLVTSIASAVNVNPGKLINALYIQQLSGLSSLQTLRNPLTEIILPDANTAVSFLIEAEPSTTSTLYTLNELVEIKGIGQYSTLAIGAFNVAHVDLSTLNLGGSFVFGAATPNNPITVNTTATNNEANLITMPSVCSNNFTGFTILAVFAQTLLDFSNYTGAFSGIFSINCQGTGFLTIILPPNIAGVTSFGISNNRRLATQTIAIDNGAGNITTMLLYRNVISNNVNQELHFDLSNCNFSNDFRCYNFNNELACWKFTDPPVNNNNFVYFHYGSFYTTDFAFRDLASIYTGVFSGTMAIDRMIGCTSFNLPLNIDAVTVLLIRDNTSNTAALTIDNGTGLLDQLVIDRNGPGASNAAKTLDLSAAIFRTSFSVNSTEAQQVWYSVILPASNSYNFTLFTFAGIEQQATIDLSIFSGNFTGTFTMHTHPNTTSVILPANVDVTSFTLRRCVALDIYIELGVDVLADTLVDLSMNAISTANIDLMIADINTNSGLFPSGCRFNFSRNSLFTAGVVSIGSNGVPSAGSITTMTTLAGGSTLFEFMYWSGAANVLIT